MWVRREGRRLRYEHLVQINDFECPELPQFAREQLWLALFAWAEHPESFDPNIDASRIVARDVGTLSREIRRGSAVNADSVRLLHGEGIEIEVGPGGGFAGSVLSVAIEEPRPAALFLRFIYRLQGDGVPRDAAEQCALRQAYYFADISTVRQIRRFAPQVV